MKGDKLLRVCSIILVFAGIIMLAAGSLGFKKVLDAKKVKTAEREEAFANIQILEEGIITLEENRQAYEDGKAAYEEGTQAYVEGKSKLSSGQAEYYTGQAALASAKQEYNKGLSAYNLRVSEYETGLALYNEKYRECLEGKAKLSDAKSQISAGESKQGAAAGRLSNLYAALSDAEVKLSDGKEQLQTFEYGEAQVEGEIKNIRENVRRAELIEVGVDPIIAGRTAVEEATQATAEELMGRLNCYIIAMAAGLMAIITGIIGYDAEKLPSVGKIKGSIIMGGLTLLTSLAANVYHIIILNKYTLDMVSDEKFVTGLQAAANAVLAIAAILFVFAIFRFKNALIALLTGK